MSASAARHNQSSRTLAMALAAAFVAGAAVAQAAEPVRTAQASPQSVQPLPREQDGGWSKYEATVTLGPIVDNPSRGTLGLTISGDLKYVLEALRPGRKAGVLVTRLFQNSTSEGVLQRGDIIVSAAGRTTNTFAEFINAYSHLTPGTPVAIEFWRYDGGFPQLQAALFRRAQENDPAATYVLGYLEMETASGEPNHARAFGFYHRAAALGHLQAMEQTGDSYRDGRGTEKNPVQAAKWYRSAAERGSTAGMYNLGYLIAEKKLGPADPPEAFRWMQRAAAGGRASAHYQLASYYDVGHGTAQDRETGARHLIVAVRTGTPDIVSIFASDATTWKPSTEFISALQRRLQEAGTYRGLINGKVSPDVKAALSQLQSGRKP